MNRKDKIINIIIPVVALFILINFTHITYASSPASCTSNSCFASDAFTFKESTFLSHFELAVLDSIKFADSSTALNTFILSVTTLITSTITILGNICTGSSCYVNVNATGMEALAEQVIFPLIFIMGTIFGFLYMGLKFFGIVVMVATFIILGLAYIGIIPSYFTLLSIVAVGAALTKMISGMIGDRGAE